MPSASDPENFSGVHDVVRIERLLDRTHNAYCLAMLSNQEIELAVTDAMLSSTGAAHGKGAHHHPFMQLLCPFIFFRVIFIDQQYQMEIPISDMSDNRGDKIGLLDIPLRLADTFSELGDGHTHIGCPDFPVGTQRLAGICCVMTRLPETVALLGIGGPLEIAPPCIGCQLLNHLSLFFNPLGRAVKFQEECRRDGKIGLGITVDGVDLRLVEQFDTRNGNAILNRIDDCPDGAIQI